MAGRSPAVRGNASAPYRLNRIRRPLPLPAAACQPGTQSQLQQTKLEKTSIAGAVAPACAAGRSPVLRGSARDACILSLISSPAYKSAKILFQYQSLAL